MFSKKSVQNNFSFGDKYKIDVTHKSSQCSYLVCYDSNCLKKYFCRLIVKPCSKNLQIQKQLKMLKNVIHIQAKEAEYEFQIGRELKHRNILNFIQRYQDMNNIYFLYDYCNKGTLRNWLNDSYRFSLKQLLSAFQQLAQAVKYLQKKNLRHLAINPNNIMVIIQQPYITFKLANFSKLQQIISQPKDHFSKGKSSQYILSGNDMNYQAPEVTAFPDIKSSKADIWSLGVVFYEMVYGRLPWKVNNVTYQVPFPQQYEIPMQIVYLLQDMLQKSLQKRFSLEEVQQYLKKLANQWNMCI